MQTDWLHGRTNLTETSLETAFTSCYYTHPKGLPDLDLNECSTAIISTLFWTL